MKIGLALPLLALFLGLSACASIGNDTQALPTKLADKVATVSDRYRPLRVCLMTAGIIEIMTDRIRFFDSSQAPEALGRLMSLQEAIDNAKLASPLWMNTDMADVALQLAHVLNSAGHEKLGRILAGGPTIGNFLDVAERATVLAVKGDAILLDINNMLVGVSDGSIGDIYAWEACHGRIAKNRATLSLLSGFAL